MLSLPQNNTPTIQNFSFNQSNPVSPKKQIVDKYIRKRQVNLIEFGRSRQVTRKNSKENTWNNMNIDLVSFSQKKSNQFDTSPKGNDVFLNSQKSFSDSLNLIQDEIDDTLREEILDLQKQFNKPLEQMKYSNYRKSITQEGQTKINQYTIKQEIGRGSFGKVKLASDYNQQYAIKICDRKRLKSKLLNNKIDAYSMLDREIAIMKKVEHPNIVKLIEVIENTQNDKMYLVLEYMDGPQLLDTNLQIDVIWRLFRDFILGLEYLHNYVNIVHMDIKPQNLLINQAMQLKIADFGVSQIMEEDQIISKAGTSAYQPPEMFTQQNIKGKPIDIWAAGLTLYQMVYGTHPFYASRQDQIKNNIINNNIHWESNSEIVDLLQKMLDKNPETRISISEILTHPWVTKKGKFPLNNQYNGQLTVSPMEIQNAITRLSFNMAIRTVSQLKQSLNRSRQRIKIRQFANT